jgi:hypothetical protein
MHLYEKSEELVKELEMAVQQEKNDSLKSQYSTLLQQQRNASANLKSLGEVNAQQGQQMTYDSEFTQEQSFTTAQYTQNQANQQETQAQKTSSLQNETTQEKKDKK